MRTRGFTGHKHTPESRKHISQRIREAFANPETRAKLIEARHKSNNKRKPPVPEHLIEDYRTLLRNRYSKAEALQVLGIVK